MTHYSLAEAEDVQFGSTQVQPRVRVGDTVQLSPNFVATITAEGLACDCGKGILCPLNPQTRVNGSFWEDVLHQAERLETDHD